MVGGRSPCFSGAYAEHGLPVLFTLNDLDVFHLHQKQGNITFVRRRGLKIKNGRLLPEPADFWLPFLAARQSRGKQENKIKEEEGARKRERERFEMDVFVSSFQRQALV